MFKIWQHRTHGIRVDFCGGKTVTSTSCPYMKTFLVSVIALRLGEVHV
jgi:hypothetical protein